MALFGAAGSVLGFSADRVWSSAHQDEDEVPAALDDAGEE